MQKQSMHNLPEFCMLFLLAPTPASLAFDSLHMEQEKQVAVSLAVWVASVASPQKWQVTCERW